MVLQRNDGRRTSQRLQHSPKPMDPIQQPNPLRKRARIRLNSSNIQHIHNSIGFNGCLCFLSALLEKQEHTVLLTTAHMWSWSRRSGSLPHQYTTHSRYLPSVCIMVWRFLSYLILQKARSATVIHFSGAGHCVVCYINSVFSLSGIRSK